MIFRNMGYLLIFNVMMLTAPFTSGERDIYHGIVNSPITLNCPSPTRDIETVKWKINASDIPFLTFYPKDNAVDPENYDRRFSFKNQTDLRVSALRVADSGRYECNIVSPAFTEEFTSVFHLSVTGGCFMPNYSQPLHAEHCLPMSYINYATPCNFRCDVGFQLNGGQTLLCQANGYFSSSLPHCKEIKACTMPPLPQHLLGRSQECFSGQTIALDATCSFTCEAGYIIKGNEVLKCSENGQFNGSIPICAENMCNIDTTNAVRPGITGDCLNEDTVPTNSTCSFTCENDYTLNGSTVVTCMADGNFDGQFPTCVEVDTDGKQANLLPLVTLVIPVLIALVIAAVCVYKKRKVSGIKADIEKENDERSTFFDQISITEKGKEASGARKLHNVKFQNEVSELQIVQPTRVHTTSHSLGQQRKHLRDLFRGYRQLLVRQLEKENRVGMLGRLYEIEVHHILPFISSNDYFDAVKNKISTLGKVWQTKEMSQEEAFAWYVVVVLAFIRNINLADDVKSEIIGMTGQQLSSTSAYQGLTSSARLSDSVQRTNEIPQGTKQYIDIVNKAFCTVINTESLHIHDQKELSNRTSTVAREMGSYLLAHGRKGEGIEASSHTQSTSQSQEDTEDKTYFGKLCVRQMNQCASVYDQVRMRYQILKSFLTNSGLVNGRESNKIDSPREMDRIIEQ